MTSSQITDLNSHFLTNLTPCTISKLQIQLSFTSYYTMGISQITSFNCHLLANYYTMGGTQSLDLICHLTASHYTMHISQVADISYN